MSTSEASFYGRHISHFVYSGSKQHIGVCCGGVRMSASFAHLGLPKAPTVEELDCLRCVPKNARDQALIEVMADCGLRVSEACNLTLDAIHWSSDTP